MIHSSYYQPRIFPLYGDVAPAEIDRAQAIDPTATLNREKVNEIGRDGAVGYVKRVPTIGYRLTQYEYGSMEFWRKLTNQADSVVKIDLGDFKTPAFDICAYLTDDDGTFLGTKVYPKLRTSGFSINIGDPDAIVERSFDFVGEDFYMLEEPMKYYIYNRHEATVGTEDEIDLTSKAPVADPDVDSGEADEVRYIHRVVRVRSGVSAELEATTDYTYSDATKVVTINSVSAGDVFKVWYYSNTTPDTLFTNNDADPSALLADSVSIYLYVPGSGKPSSSDYIYRLQSASVDVSFEREDVKEIGNKEVVQRGIRNNTVSVTLGRILESFTIEQVLRGEASGYGKLDVSKFTDEAVLIVKVFEDNTKETFKYGFKAEGLSPTDVNVGAGVEAYVNQENALEGESLVITSDNSELGNL